MNSSSSRRKSLIRSSLSNLSLHLEVGRTAGIFAAACEPLFLLFLPTRVAGLGSNFLGFFCCCGGPPGPPGPPPPCPAPGGRLPIFFLELNTKKIEKTCARLFVFFKLASSNETLKLEEHLVSFGYSYLTMYDKIYQGGTTFKFANR